MARITRIVFEFPILGVWGFGATFGVFN